MSTYSRALTVHAQRKREQEANREAFLLAKFGSKRDIEVGAGGGASAGNADGSQHASSSGAAAAAAALTPPAAAAGTMPPAQPAVVASNTKHLELADRLAAPQVQVALGEASQGGGKVAHAL